MATWDGSYQEPDGSNYYADTYGNHTSDGLPESAYYYHNSNNQQVPDAAAFHPLETSMVFNQSTSHLDNHASNYSPNTSSRSKPYPTNDLHSTANKSNMQAIETPGDSSNQLPCFYKNNEVKSQQFPRAHYNNRPNFHQNNSKRKNMNKAQISDLVEHSNLHATANEFVPSQMKQNKGNSGNLNRNNRESTNNGHQNQDVNSSSNNVFFEDNKSKMNDGRFESKRDPARRWRETPNGHYPKDERRDYGRNQNSRRYQNERQSYNKNYPEKSRYMRGSRDNLENHLTDSNVVPREGKLNETGDSLDSNNLQDESPESSNSQSIRNFKPSTNLHADRYNERKERFNPKDPRDRGRVYPEYNGYNRNNHNRDSYARESVYRDNYNKDNYNRDSHNRDPYSRDSYNRENRFERRDNRNTYFDNRDKDVTDWRQKVNDNGNRNVVLKRPHPKKYEPDDDADQRERLTEQLNRGQLECLVCCESIRQADYVWSCKNCYHVMHLKCVQKWAKSSQDEGGWRCPACQNVSPEMPEDYFCFCGKTRMPEWNRRDIAHSCGEICGRSRPDPTCVHKCTLLCHPGSCGPCSAMITKSCGCGRMSQTQKCSTGPLLQCDELCGRALNCGIHTCESKCHHGSCEPCDKLIKQECYCGQNSREETCTLNLSPLYSCENVCNKILDCGNHHCKDICHPDECKSCVLKPESVTQCCCGQTPLTEKRESCLDPIPTCDKVCCKKLKCGQPSNPHICQSNCHEGECPECDLVTKVRCRCGHMDKEIPCKELKSKADDARCEKKCTKKRSCGKHKCNQMCCIDIEHICLLPCSKTLSCGQHRCEQTCHRGRCQPCWRSSFDELYCECGAEVIYPPVACGTRRPACSKPCTREHPCGHEVLHNCHSDATCPPCSVLTQKWCYGKHELRKAVPCYVNDVSCGLPCAKPISCGRHKCVQNCHVGPCEKPGQQCVQPCTVPRDLCGHPCAAPCHEGKCPDTPCKVMVKVTCQCGNRTMSRVCAENARDYQRIASGILASKMAEMQLGHSIDLEEVFGQGAKKQNQLKTLECNEDCRMVERNRRLTLGLQIANPDLSGKLMPRYSEFMKQWGKKDPAFCQMVHDRLTELVQLAKTSKQKSRSYSFECMTRDKRQFVHESCEHFGCESQAYDQEPKRNVVATAVKDKCWLPSYSLMELMQRENGQRKVPGPMLNKSKLNSSERSMDVLQRNPKKNLTPMTKTAVSPSRSPEPEIDYFNYKGR
ncbi:hypothetical protein QAD02_019805 [Eretmocerus hayati]|uniref:Uncharacterized protein n=1 Tax=Eretmocerus hayati TaxID=131215 RepID=A0ACC2PLT0_9HYME|nr:hypothetical protein QAD02_019805 [Eretmocerus hayati]